MAKDFISVIPMQAAPADAEKALQYKNYLNLYILDVLPFGRTLFFLRLFTGIALENYRCSILHGIVYVVSLQKRTSSIF